MTYFPQFDNHSKTISLDKVLELLCEAGLVVPDAYLSRVDKSCYCDPDDGYPCNCVPEGLTFMWYTSKPNRCETCGATGDEPCRTKSGKRTAYHATRKLIEDA